MKLRALAGLVALLCCRRQPASAHPVPFTYLDVRVDSRRSTSTLVAHVFDVAHDLGIEPPERLLEPAVLAGAVTRPSRSCSQPGCAPASTAGAVALSAGRRPSRCPNGSRSGCETRLRLAGDSGR